MRSFDVRTRRSLSLLFFNVLPICNLLRGISRNEDRHSFQEKPVMRIVADPSREEVGRKDSTSGYEDRTPSRRGR